MCAYNIDKGNACSNKRSPGRHPHGCPKTLSTQDEKTLIERAVCPKQTARFSFHAYRRWSEFLVYGEPESIQFWATSKGKNDILTIYLACAIVAAGADIFWLQQNIGETYSIWDWIIIKQWRSCILHGLHLLDYLLLNMVETMHLPQLENLYSYRLFCYTYKRRNPFFRLRAERRSPPASREVREGGECRPLAGRFSVGGGTYHFVRYRGNWCLGFSLKHLGLCDVSVR